MVKLTFFVHCKSWKNGGYKNVHYFQTEKEARAWLKSQNGISLVKLETVTQAEFAEDFMGGCLL